MSKALIFLVSPEGAKKLEHSVKPVAMKHELEKVL